MDFISFPSNSHVKKKLQFAGFMLNVKRSPGICDQPEFIYKLLINKLV